MLKSLRSPAGKKTDYSLALCFLNLPEPGTPSLCYCLFVLSNRRHSFLTLVWKLVFWSAHPLPKEKTRRLGWYLRRRESIAFLNQLHLRGMYL